MGCDSTEYRGQRLEQWPWLESCHAKVKERGGDSCFVLWLKLKMGYLYVWFQQRCLTASYCQYRLLALKHLHFKMMWWKSPVVSDSRTLHIARTLFSGEEWPNFCCISIKKWLKVSVLNSAEYSEQGKSILVSLPKILARTQKQLRTEKLPLQPNISVPPS